MSSRPPPNPAPVLAARRSNLVVVGAPARPRPSVAVSGSQRLVVGYLEPIELPRWGIPRVVAKLDTGADTSALHVEDLELVGATRVSFRVWADDDAAEPRSHTIRARIARRGWIRSSNGATEERLFVRTPVRLGGRLRTVELGLVDRSHMQQRMLLGRSALEGTYLVDPGRSYLTDSGGSAELVWESQAP